MFVWLVDDDESLLDNSKALLNGEAEKNRGLNVELRTIKKLKDFEAAVRELEEPDARYPDLIFLDLRFKTTRDGYMALDLVKHHERMSVRSIPTIMFSSASETAEIKKSYRKSANAYVEKGPDPYKKFRDTLDHWMAEATLP